MLHDPIRPHEHDAGIATLLSRAMADAQLVARSEIELQKARLLAKVGGAQTGVILLAGALVLGSLALIALVVGALLILSPRTGPIGATAIVVGVLAVVAGALAWLGIRQFKTVFGSGASA